MRTLTLLGLGALLALLLSQCYPSSTPDAQPTPAPTEDTTAPPPPTPTAIPRATTCSIEALRFTGRGPTPEDATIEDAVNFRIEGNTPRSVEISIEYSGLGPYNFALNRLSPEPGYDELAQGNVGPYSGSEELRLHGWYWIDIFRADDNAPWTIDILVGCP